MSNASDHKSQEELQLESGTYEIIRNRLNTQAGELRQRINKLNDARKDVFGAIETQLIATDRINTANYCIARDIVSVGQYCIFGYNVHIGLRSGIKLQDVFSVYEYKDKHFTEKDLSILEDEKFQTDFQNLYRYYKNAFFARFAQRGSYLYMIFHLTEKGDDFKTFKWLLTDEGLVYVDNRSDHEVRFPEQHEFRWKRLSRDDQRMGMHPHVSVMDRVFVETVGGDLTIKVEDNTDDGLGIYREQVEFKDQTLDDAEYLYADLGNLIALKIRPYQEEFRYFIFNEKIQDAQRIDSLEDSGVLLPDEHGLIFANGYYLKTGEYKIFDPDMRNKLFKKRISSPNGEDYLYVFYNVQKGVYVLMHYNIIEQRVNTPIICNGFTLLPDGELCYFKSEEDPVKHHVVQIWQTPFIAGTTLPSEHTDSFLYKIGNKDIVKAMAECTEVLILTQKEDSYANLYDDIVKKSTDIIDSYYWLTDSTTYLLNEPLAQIRETAQAAIDAYEKKVRVQKETKKEIERVHTKAQDLLHQIRRSSFDSIDLFVHALADLRFLRGEIISLKELRYTDLPLIEGLEEQVGIQVVELSERCVAFLLQEEALLPYQNNITEKEAQIANLETAKQASELDEAVGQIGSELELLIEIVSNLKIEDATQTTRIIDSISLLFTKLNQVKSSINRKSEQLSKTEASAEFAAQLRLLDQSIINYLDVSDSPEKCDDYLSKLMVQLEELESKFVEINEFVEQLAEKREEAYAAFESKRNQLIEARNNRTASLQLAANRILDGIRKRMNAFESANEINGFFAADLMVDKVRDIIQQLNELGDSNKADGIQTRVKSLKEEAIRQLRDRQELFVDGKNIIQLGKHKFSVNHQVLELTIVQNNEQMLFHLTGTDFYEVVNDPAFNETKPVWNQSFVSENAEVYRGEYLAYQIFSTSSKKELNKGADALSEKVKAYANEHYQEGYTKGIHDEDALKILSKLVELSNQSSLMVYTPNVRSCGLLFWNAFCPVEKKANLEQQLKSAGVILQVFPETHEFDYLLEELEVSVKDFLEESQLFPIELSSKVANYLFKEIAQSDGYQISKEADLIKREFIDFLIGKKALKVYHSSENVLKEQTRSHFLLIRKWVQAFLEQKDDPKAWPFLNEVSLLLLFDEKELPFHKIEANTAATMEGFYGDHSVILEGTYEFDFHQLMDKMERYLNEVVPLYERFSHLKRQFIESYKSKLQLESFKPRVLTSFVRNKLIDQVYLPIFGDNFAKQLGTAGDQTRTDRMGLLLLLSPPGYGKTTLMEYIANRLGLIFVKINGPAIGHNVVSLAPQDASSLAAKRELERLNLSFEMGDNIMLYLDDIQHCNPEFLQKFISLCDAQRKIEGVYNGESKTYDLRGRRFTVVMAGNPYTESGTKFKIPDMLANRADIYNLGDIIGETANVFKMSYVENALTSNGTLSQLAGKSMKDVYTLIQMVETGSKEGLEFEAQHSPDEIAEYISVLEKLLKVRDVILTVNQEYIRSAAMSDEYRTEPAFKLQGSYRNMNKLAEKINPIMNNEELDAMVMSHYEGESQTLTADAEANLLKLKELIHVINKEEQTRWAEIKSTFNKNKVLKGMDEQNPVAQVVAQMSTFSDGLMGIKEVLEKNIQSSKSK
ncbi:MAG: DNA repair ATPase [Bacteroidota bacterium]